MVSPENYMRLRNENERLKQTVSDLGRENEELKCELEQAREDFNKLMRSYDEATLEKEAIKEDLNARLQHVQQFANVLYEKLSAYKRRIYEDQMHNFKT